MCPGKELFERDEIAQTLAHFLPIDGNHVVVHPIFHHRFALTRHSLCYLALMMGEDKVHASAMNIEMVA